MNHAFISDAIKCLCKCYNSMRGWSTTGIQLYKSCIDIISPSNLN